MIGKAVETSPDVAKEIVRRGHEAAAHGRVWENSYQLPRDQEKRFIADSVETIEKVTGQKPIGWNAYWMRNSIYILETLQDLGFLYHIDEPSHDEPFIIPVRGRDFVTVPYTFHMNDIGSFPFEGWNPAAYEQALRDEFDQLYEEGARRRRMMVVSEPVRLCRRKAVECQRTALTATNPNVRLRYFQSRQAVGRNGGRSGAADQWVLPIQRTGSRYLSKTVSKIASELLTASRVGLTP